MDEDFANLDILASQVKDYSAILSKYEKQLRDQFIKCSRTQHRRKSAIKSLSQHSLTYQVTPSTTYCNRFYPFNVDKVE